jgi:hypothetical protein
MIQAVDPEVDEPARRGGSLRRFLSSLTNILTGPLDGGHLKEESSRIQGGAVMEPRINYAKVAPGALGIVRE